MYFTNVQNLFQLMSSLKLIIYIFKMYENRDSDLFEWGIYEFESKIFFCKKVVL